MRLIDADALREDWLWREGQAYVPNDILRSIDGAPTVNTEHKVVRRIDKIKEYVAAMTVEEMAKAIGNRFNRFDDLVFFDSRNWCTAVGMCDMDCDGCREKWLNEVIEE